MATQPDNESPRPSTVDVDIEVVGGVVVTTMGLVAISIATLATYVERGLLWTIPALGILTATGLGYAVLRLWHLRRK